MAKTIEYIHVFCGTTVYFYLFFPNCGQYKTLRINGYLCVSFALSIQICFYLKLARCIERLSGFAEKYKSIPTLGYTHFQ